MFSRFFLLLYDKNNGKYVVRIVLVGTRRSTMWLRNKITFFVWL